MATNILCQIIPADIRIEAREIDLPGRVHLVGMKRIDEDIPADMHTEGRETTKPAEPYRNGNELY